MRSLYSVAIVVLYAAIISYAAPNSTGIEWSIDDPSSWSNFEINEAAKKEALDIVISLEKKFAAKYLSIATKNVTHGAFSPLVEFISLSLLSFGTQGSTRTKLMEGLGFTNYSLPTILLGFQELIDTLNKLSDGKSLVRNKMVVSFGISPDPKFTNLTKESFRWSIEDGNSPRIIKNLRAYLTNLYPGLRGLFTPNRQYLTQSSSAEFSGDWKIPFGPTFADLLTFLCTYDNCTTIEAMVAFGQFRHGRLSDFASDYVELPFKTTGNENNISMIVIRPDEHKSYRKLINKLHTIDIEKDIFNNTRTADFRVILPVFAIEKTTVSDSWIPEFFGSANNPLASGTNVSGFVNSHDLSLIGMYNTVRVEVCERGGLAGAKSVMRHRARKIRSPRVHRRVPFVADRPFVAIVATTGPKVIQLYTSFFDDYLSVSSGSDDIRAITGIETRPAVTLFEAIRRRLCQRFPDA